MRDATDIIAMHGMDDADMLTIVAAVAVGMLVAGIPLSRRIARYERPKPTPFPDVSDLGETIIAEWPDDRAAAMLEAWCTERARRDLHAMRQAADVDFGQAAQAVTKRGAFLRGISFSDYPGIYCGHACLADRSIGYFSPSSIWTASANSS